jgi:hypothetical protein
VSLLGAAGSKLEECDQNWKKKKEKSERGNAATLAFHYAEKPRRSALCLALARPELLAEAGAIKSINEVKESKLAVNATLRVNKLIKSIGASRRQKNNCSAVGAMTLLDA